MLSVVRIVYYSLQVAQQSSPSTTQSINLAGYFFFLILGLAQQLSVGDLMVITKQTLIMGKSSVQQVGHVNLSFRCWQILMRELIYLWIFLILIAQIATVVIVMKQSPPLDLKIIAICIASAYFVTAVYILSSTIHFLCEL